MATRLDWTPRQLALFERKGPKGVRRAQAKPRPALEKDMQIALVDMLRVAAKPEWFWSAIPSGELRTEKTGALLKRLGLKPGMPDLLFIGPDGRCYFLELKRGRLGRFSLAQELFGSLMLARGVPYAVARSFAEAEAQLRAWGVLK